MNVIFAIILLVFGIALCVCVMMFGIKYEEYRKAYIRITLPHSKEFYRKKMNKHLSMMIVTFVIMLLFIMLCFVILFV